MDESERYQEARKRTMQERLGGKNMRCVICGEHDARCLENHHLAGQRFGDDLVPVCRNCHRKLSDAQKDHPRPIADDPGVLERIGHFLLGLADFLVLVAVRLKEFGHELVDKVRGARSTEGRS
jgi:hypothetical protein